MTIAPPSDDKGSWELFCEDGEMKLYTREVVTSDGMVVDPLRAVHTVQGTVHFDPLVINWRMLENLSVNFSFTGHESDRITGKLIHNTAWLMTRKNEISENNLDEFSRICQ